MAVPTSFVALKALAMSPRTGKGPVVAQRMPEHIIRNITVASRPVLGVNGKWRDPLLSRRKLAVLEKSFRMAGFIWEVPPIKVPKEPKPPKPFKLPKHERAEVKEKRRKMIEKNLKEMPQKIEQHHKALREERRKMREKGSNVLLNHPEKIVNKRYLRELAAKRKEERMAKKAAVKGPLSVAAQAASDALTPPPTQ